MTRARTTRSYRGNTLILETRIETADGVVLLIDFMPPRGRNSDIVRLVRGESGRVRMRMELVLRFDYGRTVPWVTRMDDGALRAIAGPDLVTLHTPAPIRGEDLKTVAEFEVAAGETVPFVLTHGPSNHKPPKAIDPESALEETEKFWTKWAAHGKSRGEWDEAVMRSQIILKALTYAPTGGSGRGADNFAAGADRRHAQLGLPLLLAARCDHDAARDDERRLLRRSPRLERVAAARRSRRAGAAADHVRPRGRAAGCPSSRFPGCLATRTRTPVRVGNAAHDQLQLDVYGEVMDALHQARRGGLKLTDADWAFQCSVLKHLEAVWQKPDYGLWEIRGEPRHFTYSKVMCLGRLRSRHPRRRTVRAGWPGAPLAPAASDHSQRGVRTRIR